MLLLRWHLTESFEWQPWQRVPWWSMLMQHHMTCGSLPSKNYCSCTCTSLWQLRTVSHTSSIFSPGIFHGSLQNDHLLFIWCDDVHTNDLLLHVFRCHVYFLELNYATYIYNLSIDFMVFAGSSIGGWFHAKNFNYLTWWIVLSRHVGYGSAIGGF